MDYLPNTDGLTRSTIRDTIMRLRRIRARCGKEDDMSTVSTGDRFRDITSTFVQQVEKVKLNIQERNGSCSKYGPDRMSIEQSVAIRKDITHMAVLLEELKKVIDENARALARENQKKVPKRNKITLLEKTLEVRQSQYNECMTMLDIVKEMDVERLQTQRYGVDTVQEQEMGKKLRLRERLGDMRRTNTDENAHTDTNVPTWSDTTTGGGRLEDNEAHKQYMTVIAEQDVKINAGLDRLKEGVGRLRELAIAIGTQLDIHNEVLDNTEHTVTKQSAKLRTMNGRLQRLMKAHKPMNICITVFCIIFLIALIGFFLVMFNVI